MTLDHFLIFFSHFNYVCMVHVQCIYLRCLCVQSVLSLGVFVNQKALFISLLLGEVKVLLCGGQMQPGGGELLFSGRQML